jgi:hypothetical protein
MRDSTGGGGENNHIVNHTGREDTAATGKHNHTSSQARNAIVIVSIRIGRVPSTLISDST